jgi:hypothetical protein
MEVCVGEAGAAEVASWIAAELEEIACVRLARRRPVDAAAAADNHRAGVRDGK